MIKIISILIISFGALKSLAQTAIVKGKIYDESMHALPDASVILPGLKVMTTTDTNGNFCLQSVPFGKHELVFSLGYSKEHLKITVTDTIIDLGVLSMHIGDEGLTADDPGLETEGEREKDEESSVAYISGILNASKDVYLSAAAFNLSTFRYQVRGYKRNQAEVYMNGLLMNDPESGTASWGQWGGLNDVFRNQHTTFALSSSDAGIGGLAGSTSIDATAAVQRKQLRITYSVANRSYSNRIMLTYSTGLLQSGWAFSCSGSKRWSGEGYIPGTFLNSYSWYAAISKMINPLHYIHIATFGSPTVRGKAMPATQEAINIAGDNYYNPNWGWLNGTKRNARISRYFQPAAILTYEYKPDPATHFMLSALYQQSYNGNSALDWYNALDPRPDYYSRLPGYYLGNATAVDSIAARQVLEELQENPGKMQIDWGRIYEANRFNNVSWNGVAGNRSLYVIGEDRDDNRKLSLAATLQKLTGNHFAFYLGESLTTQYTESYRVLRDLLGGDFYVNLNQFAERSYPGNSSFNQNDLNNTNGIIKTGDRYNYNYKSHFLKLFGWGQIQGSFKRIDAFVAVRACLDIFDREGIFRNGLFPEMSEGRSPPNNFRTYSAKAGITFKITGRNYFSLNSSIATNPPSFDNTYISPRTRNSIVQDPSVEKIRSLEGSYVLHTPKITGKLTAFFTGLRDITEIRRFYHEDYRTFVNYAMKHIDIRHLGTELAVKANLSPALSTTLVISWKQVFYTSRPAISIYKDNDTGSNVPTGIAYINNFNVAAGPQSACVISLNYNSPKFWYANVSCNYTDRNYVDINPSRRTADALDLITPGTGAWKAILEQERLPAFYTIDIFAGKSVLLSKSMKWLPRGTYLYLNLGINNILNKRNIITGGFEQLRYDYTNRNPERFPSKYFYAQGINYFLNISIKF